MPEVVSQQFVPPLATAGQLFWQSVFAAHVVGQALPPLLPPDELPFEPPEDVPLEPLDPFPDDELFELPSSPLGAVAS